MAELVAAVRRHRLGVFVLVALALLAWILWSARGALPAFVIGLALAFVLDPGVSLLHRRGVPRWLGVLVMYVVVVAFVWAVIAFAVPPIGEQLNEFLRRLPELGQTVESLQRAVNEWYAGLAIPGPLRTAIDESLRTGEQAVGDLVAGVAGPLFGTLLRTATFIFGLLIVPVWLFFVLKDRERLPDAIALTLPPEWRADAKHGLALLSRVGGRWVRGQLLLGASIFVATAIGLTALTILGFAEFGRFTLILALIAGVLEWLPIIGPIIAAIPALLIAVTISPGAVVAVVVLYTLIQQLENNLLVPKVMGDAIELHPAVMILALVVGGSLFGFWGAILAAPVLAALRDVYRYTFLRLSGEVPAVAAVLATGGPTAPPAVEPAASGEPAPSA